MGDALLAAAVGVAFIHLSSTALNQYLHSAAEGPLSLGLASLLGSKRVNRNESLQSMGRWKELKKCCRMTP